MNKIGRLRRLYRDPYNPHKTGNGKSNKYQPEDLLLSGKDKGGKESEKHREITWQAQWNLEASLFFFSLSFYSNFS